MSIYTFDLEQLLSDMSGDHDRLRELTFRVAGELPRYLLDLRDCVERKSADRVLHWAHLLTSTLMSLSAYKASEAASRLLRAAEFGEIPELNAALEALETEVDLLIRDLVALHEVTAAIS